MKNQKKNLKANLPIDSKWLILGLVLLLIISIKAVSVFLGLNIKTTPTPVPTPTSTVKKILPPDAESLPRQIYLDMAIADLVNKLQINKQVIKTIQVEARSFNDTSLGCPEKGKMYPQVITPGFVITLSAMGKTYTYHAGLDRVVNCSSN